MANRCRGTCLDNVLCLAQHRAELHGRQDGCPSDVQQVCVAAAAANIDEGCAPVPRGIPAPYSYGVGQLGLYVLVAVHVCNQVRTDASCIIPLAFPRFECQADTAHDHARSVAAGSYAEGPLTGGQAGRQASTQAGYSAQSAVPSSCFICCQLCRSLLCCNVAPVR